MTTYMTCMTYTFTPAPVIVHTTNGPDPSATDMPRRILGSGGRVEEGVPTRQILGTGGLQDLPRVGALLHLRTG